MKNLARKTITTATIAPVPDLGLNASTSFNGAKDNQRPFSPYRKRTAPFRSMLLTWLLMFVTVALFILTVYYALRPILGPHASWVGSSPSHAILLLRILSEGAGLFCAATVASSTECLQWMLVSRKIGLRLSTLLGLQTGTGVKGLLSLMIVSGIAPGTRLWSLVRLCFIAIVPILSVIIMSDVTTQTVFQAQDYFPVAAGIGSLNSSFAQDYSLIAGIYFATDFTSFLSDPKRVVPIPPIRHSNATCASIISEKNTPACGSSHFVAGGLELITPWPSRNNDLPDVGFYVVQDIQGYQLDFTQLESDAGFDGVKDCRVYGGQSSAIQICLSSTVNDRLDAKFVHCPLILSSSNACLQNSTWHDSTGWATSMLSYRRRATISFSRTNGTILSLTSPSPPISAQVQSSDLLATYDASFGNASLSGFGGQANTQFLDFVASTLTFAETSSLAFRSAESYLRNLLALPLYYYHANNLSPTILPSPNAPLPGLPSELYTRASLATAWHKLVVGRTSVLVYLAGGAIAISACLVVLILGSLPLTAANVPETSSWPALDFATNCHGSANGQHGEPISETLRECRGLKGSPLRERIGRIRVSMPPTVAGHGPGPAPGSPPFPPSESVKQEERQG